MPKPFRLFGGTVRSALLHAVTDYDRKQQARAERQRTHFNHYALAHYLRRVDDITEDMAAGATPRAAVLAAFCGRLSDVALRAIGEPLATLPEIRSASSYITYTPASKRHA